MRYATQELSDENRAEVTRAQRSQISDWQIGKLRALLVSTASVQDREEIQRAIDHQYGGTA